MSAQGKEQALERIRRLAGGGLDVRSFFREATEALTTAVANNGGTGVDPFWYTLDPASLLITSMVGSCDLPIDDVVKFEYLDDDFNKAVDVTSNPRGVQTLRESTGGDPNRSPVYREYMRPRGIGQEALVALRTRRGENWGTVRLVRAAGQDEFDSDDLEFLRIVAPHLAEGARRGLLVGEAGEPEGPDAPGLVILDEDWAVESVTPAGGELLEEIADGENSGSLPVGVLAVAARALAIADGQESPTNEALARVLSRHGRWIVLHGAVLGAIGSRKVAVIIEPDRQARIVPLLMRLYGLSAREQEVARHVLRGDSTARISAALHLSAHTVQEHLKRIFDKTEVRSRRDLVGKVFFNHYAPRVRDNEQRRGGGKPIRGGPFPPDRSDPPPP